ncbi:MAG: hypothetical protein AAFQ82_11310 [Myxococcota bacterium]
MTTPIRPPLPRPVALPDPGAAEGAVPARTPIPDLPLGESAPEESSSWWSTGLNAPVASVIPVQGGGLNDANRLADGLMSLGFELLESDEPSDVLRLRGEIENYPRPVNVFIPSDFVRDTEFDLALHLHGWTNAAWTETERVVFGEFDFRAIAGESGSGDHSPGPPRARRTRPRLRENRTRQRPPVRSRSARRWSSRAGEAPDRTRCPEQNRMG